MQVVRILVEKIDRWYTATAMDDMGVLLNAGGSSRSAAVAVCKEKVTAHYAPQMVDFITEDLR